MGIIKSFIESDVLADQKGLSHVFRINFECDYSAQGIDGDVICADENGEAIDFAHLPAEDQAKIEEACVEKYAESMENCRDARENR